MPGFVAELIARSLRGAGLAYWHLWQRRHRAAEVRSEPRRAVAPRRRAEVTAAKAGRPR